MTPSRCLSLHYNDQVKIVQVFQGHKMAARPKSISLGYKFSLDILNLVFSYYKD